MAVNEAVEEVRDPEDQTEQEEVTSGGLAFGIIILSILILIIIVLLAFPELPSQIVNHIKGNEDEPSVQVVVTPPSKTTHITTTATSATEEPIVGKMLSALTSYRPTRMHIVVIVICTIILLATITSVIVLLNLRGQDDTIFIEPAKTVDPVTAPEDTTELTGFQRLGKAWDTMRQFCQDLFPPRIDYMLAACLGYVLAMIIATFFPQPTEWLSRSVIIRLCAIMLISIFEVLFLPSGYIIVSGCFALALTFSRWATWNIIIVDQDQILTPLDRILQVLRKYKLHFVNIGVAIALLGYSAWMLSGLYEERGWEHWAMAPLLSALTAAALSYTLIRRPPHHVLSGLYCILGLIFALFYAWYFDTLVFAELVIAAGVWAICHFNSEYKVT